MTNKQVKEAIIQALFSRDIYTKQVNDVQYRTRCPYCGDSSNPDTGHLYLKINPEDNKNIVYFCQRCPAHGILTDSTLSMLEINDIDLKSAVKGLNKTSDKNDKKNISMENKTVFFDYETPECIRNDKVKYVEDRLGLSFTDEDLKRIRIISSFRDFLLHNHIRKITTNKMIAEKLEDHYVGFLTYGNSHILFRDITGKEEYRWIKYPICKDSNENRTIYTISTSIDPLSPEPLTINLSEGVMDIISVCYNLGLDENCLNVCVAGKYYERVLLFLIDLGLVGTNISINIFSDNDEKFNNKNSAPTTPAYYKRILKNFKYLYGKITIYYNTIGKDVGVERDSISLQSFVI